MGRGDGEKTGALWLLKVFRLSDLCKDMIRVQMQTNAEAEHE